MNENMNIEKISKNKIIKDMQEFIRCKTVSNINKDYVDWKEFEKFKKLLFKLFPTVTKRAKFFEKGQTGLIFFLKGKESFIGENKKTARVLMAHYDVVPANEAEWKKNPFSGEVKDGELWGRGTLDTKGTLLSIFEALEFMFQNNWQNEKDLYLCFSGDEEVNGESCPAIVKWFEENKIKVEFVLDEGGAIVDKSFPGVKEKCAMIGIAEKGSVNLNVELEKKGGHASTPPKNTAAGIISKACSKIEKSSFKFQYTSAVSQMIKTFSKHTSFGLKIILKNLWLFMPLFKLITKLAGGEFYAMTHTTKAVTMLSGSDAFNVLPEKATMGINLRLLGKDTMDSAKKYIEKTCKNSNLKFEIVNGSNPSITSDTKCEQWFLLTDVIKETWSNVLVSPYLMMACSDSRHFCRITDKVYRFSGMYMSKEDRAMIHSKDERIKVETLFETVKFYFNLLKRM
ncbi:MAG: M20/M25/M40 family metallo-hydrolase [Treponema sp.]|nr:M20/M25/M40 family metallo-hydrolase [Treponema sp.]